MKKIILTEEQKKKFQELYDAHKKDTEIAEILGLSRKIIGKYRRICGLPSYKDTDYIDLEKLKKLCSLGYSITRISKELKTSPIKIKQVAAANAIELPFSFVITPEKEGIILELYNQGKTDTEIAKITGVKAGTVAYYRKSHNLPTKFTYSKIDKISKTNFKELFEAGLSDYAIAKAIGMSPDGVYSHRMRHGFLRKSLAEAKYQPLSSYQKQVLLGIMLGDGSMRIFKNPKFTTAHCPAQKEYSEHIAEVFKNLGGKCIYRKRNTPDCRTGIRYESYTVSVDTNPAYLPYYNSLYKKGKKHIPIDLLDDFTEVSLAYMFMDDGFKTPCSYALSTNCFSIEELQQFQNFLKIRFNLETSLHRDHVLYIKACSRDTFTELVSPYVVPCLQYKLHKKSS